MADTIQIHGRSSFNAEVAFSDGGVAVDLTGKVLFFELAGGAFRKALVPSIKSPLNATLHLTVAEVVNNIPTSRTDFIIRDETIPGDELVLGEGSIKRTGWK